jgi:hypothetical protein
LTLGDGAQAQHTYLGMDRNDYPGDANMMALRKTFAFTGYWLNNPPGANRNTWRGKRKSIETMGYGFLLLFNGREYAQLKALGNAARVGTNDAAAAVRSAQQEGFAKGAIIFLDQEQGGRMLPEQRAYIHAWVDGVTRAGYGAGNLLLGNSVSRVGRGFGGDGQRYSRARGQTGDTFLCQQRSVPAVCRAALFRGRGRALEIAECHSPMRGSLRNLRGVRR